MKRRSPRGGEVPAGGMIGIGRCADRLVALEVILLPGAVALRDAIALAGEYVVDEPCPHWSDARVPVLMLGGGEPDGAAALWSGATSIPNRSRTRLIRVHSSSGSCRAGALPSAGRTQLRRQKASCRQHASTSSCRSRSSFSLASCVASRCATIARACSCCARCSRSRASRRRRSPTPPPT